MKLKFTDAQRKALHEGVCVCGAVAVDVEYDDLTVDGDFVSQLARCKNCGFEWFEEYEFRRVLIRGEE